MACKCRRIVDKYHEPAATEWVSGRGADGVPNIFEAVQLQNQRLGVRGALLLICRPRFRTFQAPDSGHLTPRLPHTKRSSDHKTLHFLHNTGRFAHSPPPIQDIWSGFRWCWPHKKSETMPTVDDSGTNRHHSPFVSLFHEPGPLCCPGS